MVGCLFANVALFISLRINKFYLVTVLMKSAGPKEQDAGADVGARGGGGGGPKKRTLV